MTKRKTALDRMAEDDVVVSVTFRVRVGSLRAIDEIAALRGKTRSQLLREAVSWTVSKETAWLIRERRIAAQRAEDEAEYQRTLRRNAKRRAERERDGHL